MKPFVKQSESGFTLIELLVVIAIIAILASVVLAAVNSGVDKANFVKVQQDFNSISKAANLYLNDSNNVWPASSNPAGSAPAFVPKDMTEWPKPPCAGYKYDWENNSGGTDIRVALLNASNAVIFQKCIYQKSVACTDISTVANKTLVCQ